MLIWHIENLSEHIFNTISFRKWKEFGENRMTKATIPTGWDVNIST